MSGGRASFRDKASFPRSKAIRDSGKALLCVVLGREVWIPHSQIDFDSEVFDADENADGELVISQWIAEQKELA